MGLNQNEHSKASEDHLDCPQVSIAENRYSNDGVLLGHRSDIMADERQGDEDVSNSISTDATRSVGSC